MKWTRKKKKQKVEGLIAKLRKALAVKKLFQANGFRQLENKIELNLDFRYEGGRIYVTWLAKRVISDNNFHHTHCSLQTGWLSRYNDSLCAGRSGNRIPVWAIYPYPTRPALAPTQPPL
jgi:hypothetical protein